MIECRQIDELMVDYLYQELDAEQAAAFRTHVDGCPRCGAELSGFQRTRQAFGLLPEADPPAAAVARLLHEAARRAPGREPGGIWQGLARLFAPLVQHPALAAAASLILVGGVAGYLALRGDVTERAPGAWPQAAPASVPVETTRSLEGAGGAAPAGPPAPAAATDVPESPLAGQRPQAVEERPAPVKRPAEPAPTGTTKATVPRTGSDRGGGDKPAAPRPPPPEKPAPVVDSVSETAAGEALEPEAAASRRHRAARQAATESDCATANRLRDEIAATDPGYFKMNVVADPVLAPCLPSKAVKKKPSKSFPAAD